MDPADCQTRDDRTRSGGPARARRRILAAGWQALAAGAGLAWLGRRARAAQSTAADPERPDPRYPLLAEPVASAALALAEAQRQLALAAGDQGYGAVVVQGRQVVGLGPSRVVTTGDPTAHAEVVAIRDAAWRLGRRDLSDCVLFSTAAPCRMCETAAYWGRVEAMVSGSPGATPKAPTYSDCA